MFVCSLLSIFSCLLCINTGTIYSSAWTVDCICGTRSCTYSINPYNYYCIFDYILQTKV